MKLRIFIWFLVAILGSCVFQPLQLQSPITMYSQNNSVLLQYPVPAGTPINTLFCFVQNKITKGQATTKNDITTHDCTLQDISTVYTCFRFYYDNNTYKINVAQKQIIQNQLWTSDIKFQTSKPSLRTNFLSSTDHVIKNESFTQTIQFKDFFKFKIIYHMFTCPSYNAADDSCSKMWKQNYIHTFSHPQKKINLIVQRLTSCAIFQRNGKTIYNHVFYGGAIRSNQSYMFFAILTYSNNTSDKLNMWGGISYSMDHASRDMFCYATDGSTFDAISLIAGPVYKDIATNIGGTDDAEIVDNYYSERQIPSYVYFIQYHRLYETKNKNGDERLFRKTYANYAYAAYFDFVQQNQTFVTTPNCLQSQYKHNFLVAFAANVDLFQINTVFNKFLLILVAIMTLMY